MHKTRILLPVCWLTFCSFCSLYAPHALPAAHAADGNVTILSPADGAKLGAATKNKVTYEATLGAAGGHVHLYVDDEETAVLRQHKGEYVLDPLAPGNHRVCIKLVNKAHVPTGMEHCINVTAQ
ncbi:MAG: hypothetical protein AB1513_07910 [Pseudomonadota bacterium]